MEYSVKTNIFPFIPRFPKRKRSVEEVGYIKLVKRIDIFKDLWQNKVTVYKQRYKNRIVTASSRQNLNLLVTF